MSDVLSAESETVFSAAINGEVVLDDGTTAYDPLRALQIFATSRYEWKELALKLAGERDDAEAAARAGGCAADLAEALRGIAVFCARYSDKRLAGIQECATQALISYDRAVSGQTAEKETA